MKRGVETGTEIAEINLSDADRLVLARAKLKLNVYTMAACLGMENRDYSAMERGLLTVPVTALLAAEFMALSIGETDTHIPGFGLRIKKGLHARVGKAGYDPVALPDALRMDTITEEPARLGAEDEIILEVGFQTVECLVHEDAEGKFIETGGVVYRPGPMVAYSHLFDTSGDNVPAGEVVVVHKMHETPLIKIRIMDGGVRVWGNGPARARKLTVPPDGGEPYLAPRPRNRRVILSEE